MRDVGIVAGVTEQVKSAPAAVEEIPQYENMKEVLAELKRKQQARVAPDTISVKPSSFNKRLHILCDLFSLLKNLH